MPHNPSCLRVRENVSVRNMGDEKDNGVSGAEVGEMVRRSHTDTTVEYLSCRRLAQIEKLALHLITWLTACRRAAWQCQRSVSTQHDGTVAQADWTAQHLELPHPRTVRLLRPE